MSFHMKSTPKMVTKRAGALLRLPFEEVKMS